NHTSAGLLVAKPPHCRSGELGLLPPPLWGRVGEGGGAVMHDHSLRRRPPPPAPPHKGEGRALSARPHYTSVQRTCSRTRRAGGRRKTRSARGRRCAPGSS